jgi:hypothetical protein
MADDHSANVEWRNTKKKRGNLQEEGKEEMETVEIYNFFSPNTDFHVFVGGNELTYKG